MDQTLRGARLAVAIGGVSLLGWLGGCATPVQRAQPIQRGAGEPFISRVGVDPKRFNPSSGEQATVRFQLAAPASLTVRIYDEEDLLVRMLRPGKVFSAGAHVLEWDGHDEAGTVVPDGIYVYVISAIDRSQQLHLFDPADETGGQPLKVTGGGFDQERGIIQYALPRAGRVRIRIGLKEGGPHLRTLLDWSPRQAGAQEEPWDGLDASGQMDLREHLDTRIAIRAYSLPDNSVMTYGHAAAVRQVSQPGVARERRASRQPSAGSYLHAFHPRAVCHELHFTVELPADLPRTQDGVPIVKGTVPLRITVSPDEGYLLATRFELVLYVDTVFLLEEEEGYLPFTYLLDASAIGAGPHLVTANLLTLDDHFGVVTTNVVVEP